MKLLSASCFNIHAFKNVIVYVGCRMSLIVVEVQPGREAVDFLGFYHPDMLQRKK